MLLWPKRGFEEALVSSVWASLLAFFEEGQDERARPPLQKRVRALPNEKLGASLDFSGEAGGAFFFNKLDRIRDADYVSLLDRNTGTFNLEMAGNVSREEVCRLRVQAKFDFAGAGGSFSRRAIYNCIVELLHQPLKIAPFV